jgi:hypothetical protein
LRWGFLLSLAGQQTQVVDYKAQNRLLEGTHA